MSDSIHATLAKLRLSILTTGETLPDKCWDSTGLCAAGQTDLLMVFPRTSLLAAYTHAADLARSHHDERTRASGVYHLFRLPTHTETAIHREFNRSIPNDYDLAQDVWSEIAELPDTNAKDQDGPVNLGEVDLTNPKDIAKIAQTYKSAFDSAKVAIPYFTITE